MRCPAALKFERYVNSKDNQTVSELMDVRVMFERYVNSKDNQTTKPQLKEHLGLRDM